MGRKTEVKDEWIADLLRHGLLRGSFVPSRAQRKLRELLRYRRSLIEEESREANRIQKLLEGTSIKLGSGARACSLGSTPGSARAAPRKKAAHRLGFAGSPGIKFSCAARAGVVL